VLGMQSFRNLPLLQDRFKPLIQKKCYRARHPLQAVRQELHTSPEAIRVTSQKVVLIDDYPKTISALPPVNAPPHRQKHPRTNDYNPPSNSS
jgi:hypothetical protein